MQPLTRRLAPIALLAVLAASVFAAAPAHADDVTSIAFEPTTISAEYGAGWSAYALGTNTWFIAGPWKGSATATGLPSGYTLNVSSYSEQARLTHVYIGSDFGSRPLVPGTYSITAAVTDSSGGSVTTATPATLTISKAPLGIEARISEDPADPTNAVVTARFTGEFVSNQSPAVYEWAPFTPAGAWEITISDEAGEVVLDRTIERTATDDVMATSFYWQDAKPGKEYTVNASFAPTTDSAKNFAITAASPFDYTASSEARPVPVSTAAEVTPAETPPEPDFSVPVWWVVLISIALAALLAFAVVFAIRLGRAPRLTPTTESENA